jgi:hypothetical protein
MITTQNKYIIFILLTIGIPAYIYSSYYKNRQKKQLQFIKNYTFHKRIQEKVKEHYPHLSDEEINKVIFALRDYFFIANRAYGKTIAMPSKVVDVAWHEFIIFTKEYEYFCKHAFDKFFHHTPTEPIANKKTIDESLKRTWKYACFKENIIPSSPDKLPLLFAIDKFLKIKDGNIYTLGNNLTNTLASHRYGCSGASCGGGSGTGCSGHSCGGGSSCGGS